MTVQLWLWLATAGMAVGSVLLFFPMLRNRAVSEEGDTISHFLVPVVAMTLYLLMALGFGTVELASGRVFYFARYIDWSITTPLLLLSLVSGAVKHHANKRGGLVAGLVGADVYMIGTGFVAGVTDVPVLKWSFYGLSCLAFLMIYGMLFGPFKRLAEAGPKGAVFTRKAVALSVLWLAYPVVFLLGQEGLKLWSPTVDAALFAILDVTAKVVYGLWAVRMLKGVPDASATPVERSY